MLIYKNFKIKHGDIIEGTINGTKVKGKLSIKGKKYYFCQNKKKGELPPDRFEYNFSWRFDKVDLNKLSQGVVINKHNNTEADSSKVGYTYRELVSKHANCNVNTQTIKFENKRIIQIDDDRFDIINPSVKPEISLFKMRNHPDCCGAIILFNFENSESHEYSRYKNLSDDDYENIKAFLRTNPAKLVHLSHKQVTAQAFVEKLGFKKMYEYTNPNSKNDIYVYHLHSYNENSES